MRWKKLGIIQILSVTLVATLGLCIQFSNADSMSGTANVGYSVTAGHNAEKETKMKGAGFRRRRQVEGPAQGIGVQGRQPLGQTGVNLSPPTQTPVDLGLQLQGQQGVGQSGANLNFQNQPPTSDFAQGQPNSALQSPSLLQPESQDNEGGPISLEPLDAPYTISTQTQARFYRINYNYNLSLAYQTSYTIQSDTVLRRSLVTNPDGVTCDDVCDCRGIGFGVIGLCTPDYCQCNQQTKQPTQFSCPRDQVFNMLTLRCDYPANTILCSDDSGVSAYETPTVPDNPVNGEGTSSTDQVTGADIFNQQNSFDYSAAPIALTRNQQYSTAELKQPVGFTQQSSGSATIHDTTPLTDVPGQQFGNLDQYSSLDAFQSEPATTITPGGTGSVDKNLEQSISSSIRQQAKISTIISKSTSSRILELLGLLGIVQKSSIGLVAGQNSENFGIYKEGNIAKLVQNGELSTSPEQTVTLILITQLQGEVARTVANAVTGEVSAEQLPHPETGPSQQLTGFGGSDSSQIDVSGISSSFAASQKSLISGISLLNPEHIGQESSSALSHSQSTQYNNNYSAHKYLKSALYTEGLEGGIRESEATGSLSKGQPVQAAETAVYKHLEQSNKSENSAHAVFSGYTHTHQQGGSSTSGVGTISHNSGADGCAAANCYPIPNHASSTSNVVYPQRLFTQKNSATDNFV